MRTSDDTVLEQGLKRNVKRAFARGLARRIEYAVNALGRPDYIVACISNTNKINGVRKFITAAREQ